MLLATILQWKKNAARRRLFEDTMQEHGDALARVAISYAPPGALREDLEQEIALGVWEALPSWREDASLKTFLFRVAHNRCIDIIRKHNPEEPLHDDIGQLPTLELSPESHASIQERMQRAQALIRQLPPAQRQALTLRLEGLSYEEISEITGLESNHIGVLIHRARTTLQRKETTR